MHALNIIVPVASSGVMYSNTENFDSMKKYQKVAIKIQHKDRFSLKVIDTT